MLVSRVFADDNAPYRIACIGDSITAGARVDAKTQSYPSQLQILLGPKYVVHNFGIGGATLIKPGKPNIWQRYEEIVEFRPNVVVVSLGTNDTVGGKRKNWEKIKRFESDYDELISGLANSGEQPRIILCTPTPMLLETEGLSQARVENLTERKPRLQDLCKRIRCIAANHEKHHLELLELNALLAGKPEFLTPGDGVHPNAAGYLQIAKAVASKILSAPPTTNQPLSAARKRRPNVILIMTDDQGYGDMSCHGDPHMQAPNIDALYADSIRFTDFHVSPFCTPTRAGLMTGRYPGRTGAYRTSSGRTSIHPREKTLGDLFLHNGYSTGMFGKWHLGDCAPSRPMDSGFDVSVWHRCGGVTQISDYWTNDYFDDTYLVGDRWKQFSGYCTDVWFDQTMEFIQGAMDDAGGEKPFFVYLATNAPHGPYLVGEKWKKPFIDAGLPKQQAAFKGMVANFDWNLGRLQDFLKQQQLDQETLIVYMTDNGTSAGTIFGQGGRITGWPKDPDENAGMRGGKSSAYDGGHRVPFFLRLPGQTDARDIDTLAAHLDVTPTLMDLCNLQRPLQWPALDGRSLMQLIEDEQAAWPDRILHSQMHGGNGYVKPGDPWEIGVAMTEQWRLVEGRELYDIVEDPSQRTNVAEQHPEVFQRLNTAHLEWHQSVQEGMQPTRIVIGSADENPTELTSQEWVMPVGGPPWSHSHVVRRQLKNGPWWLDVKQAGRYRFELSRWPIYLNQSIESVAAGIRIEANEAQVKIENDSQTTAEFELELEAGPTELSTWLETKQGQRHGAYFCRVTYLPSTSSAKPSILWTQYGLSNRTLKLVVHTDADPRNRSEAEVDFQVQDAAGNWDTVGTSTVQPLTSMAVFRIEDWEHSQPHRYRVVCGKSNWEGVIRSEPLDREQFRLMAVACVNDNYFPYAEAVAQMIRQDPDLVFFAGDQIYESNAGGEVIKPATLEEVPAGMANYLAKWRRFGIIFRELLKDRPSIMITDDHDVYANDLWGDGGKRMQGDRTTGGYPTHPAWVNAVEATQTAHLPDAVAPGPWGDGIQAYFTALDYGGITFAIVEDRKFKSPPNLVLEQPVNDPTDNRPNRTLEVIKDPAFDVAKLEREDLQLLGREQEQFLSDWAEAAIASNKLAAVLNQSPLCNIGNYDPRYGDMDSNGWPKTGRDRALRCIQAAQPVMIAGDIHYGTLSRHGINDWGDGPWSYSVPAFASKQNRRWSPSVPAQGNAIPGIEGSGDHHDRFQNKLTVLGTAPGTQGYG
ncbi:MAG: sulfatase-like hydrolase/transferase, partial [Planctomycetota bacterium]